MKSRPDAGLICGAVLAGLVLGLTLAGIFLAPASQDAMNPGKRFLPPGREHILGTDNFGRDIFARLAAGARHTLFVAFLTVAGAAFAGSALGLLSGWSGGIIDEILMRLMDTLTSFPGILLALLMVSLFGTGTATLVLALFLLFVPSFVRIMRAGTFKYRNRDFVRTALIQGCPTARLLFVHILPNLLPELLSALVLGLGNAILAEATMSYLGLGIQPPRPSWGRMLAESQHYLWTAPWCALAPGIMIMLTVAAFHFVGEGLRRVREE